MIKHNIRYLVVALVTGLLTLGGVSSEASLYDIGPKSESYLSSLPRAAFEYLSLSVSLEQKLRLPPMLLIEVARRESGFRQDVITCQVVSPAGAKGLMQINPKWHPLVDPCNPYLAMAYAAYYLHKLNVHYKGDWVLTLSAYNWGVGNVDRCLARKRCKIPRAVTDYSYGILHRIDMHLV